MIRSSVVLPQPEGPRSATSSPCPMSSETLSSAAKRPKRLERFLISMLMRQAVALRGVSASRVLSTDVRGPDRCLVGALGAPLDQRLECERDKRQQREDRSDGERRDDLIFVVQKLDVQRHRRRFAADMARHDADGAELAHRPCIAKDDAVQQTPLDVRQRHREEGAPARGAQRQCGLFLFRALRLHQRDQFARHERNGDEDRRDHDARAPRRSL